MNLSPNRWLYVLVAALILAVLLLSIPTPRTPAAEIPYSEFEELVARGQVEEVTLRGTELTATLTEPRRVGSDDAPTRLVGTRIPAFGDQDLMNLLEREDVEIRTLPEGPGGLARMFQLLLPWIVLIGIYWRLWRRFRQSMGGAFGGRPVEDFLSASARKENGSGPKVTFADIAGQENAKREVSELVDFLREPAKHTSRGGATPWRPARRPARDRKYDCVALVDEDDAWRALLCFLEHLAHARGADAHAHLDELGRQDVEEGRAGLARKRPRQQPN